MTDLLLSQAQTTGSFTDIPLQYNQSRQPSCSTANFPHCQPQPACSSPRCIQMQQTCRAQAVVDYPELAICVKQDTDKHSNTYHEEEVHKFLAMQSDEYRTQDMYDYPELASVIQSSKDRFHQHSLTDHVLAAITKQGIGPRDAYIWSMNANSQSRTHSMPATNHLTRQSSVNTIHFRLTYPITQPLLPFYR
jgi:hypothetical protein